jgi:xanthine dehydrogenase accessory factor
LNVNLATSPMAANHIDLWQEAIRLHNDGVPFCTVTVADARGSIPQEIGAKALMNRDGLICGTIGGGRVEARGCAKARELLAPESKQRTLLERINLHKDVGMTCAGEMTLLYEVFRPDLEWNIAVFGAGHVSQKLCRLLIELECRVTCFDSRSEWLDRLPQSARLERRLVNDFADGIPDIPRGAFVVVMTMGHATDLPVLRTLSRADNDVAFVGVLGSDSKAAIMRRELLDAGVEKAFVDRLGCPLGEKFGDNTPSDIAVSILALLVRLRRELANN